MHAYCYQGDKRSQPEMAFIKFIFHLYLGEIMIKAIVIDARQPNVTEELDDPFITMINCPEPLKVIYIRPQEFTVSKKTP